MGKIHGARALTGKTVAIRHQTAIPCGRPVEVIVGEKGRNPSSDGYPLWGFLKNPSNFPVKIGVLSMTILHLFD